MVPICTERSRPRPRQLRTLSHLPLRHLLRQVIGPRHMNLLLRRRTIQGWQTNTSMICSGDLHVPLELYPNMIVTPVLWNSIRYRLHTSNHRGYWRWWAELTMNDSSMRQYVIIVGTAIYFFPFTLLNPYRQSERSGQLELWSLIGWAIWRFTQLFYGTFSKTCSFHISHKNL
jgi:hypothetical protein